MTIKEQADEFMLYLRRLQTDRGAMADLRCALNPTRRHRSWPLLARIGGIEDPIRETVAALFAFNPNETSKGNLGTTCRRLGAEHTTIDARFRRLLTCDLHEISSRLHPIVLTAKAKGVPINYEQLFIDLHYWGDRTKARWATEFWGASQASEEQAEEAAVELP
jgi:CRISPR system Cascade subunit CasB